MCWLLFQNIIIISQNVLFVKGVGNIFWENIVISEIYAVVLIISISAIGYNAHLMI